MDSQKLLDEGFAGGKTRFDLLAAFSPRFLDLLQADRLPSQFLTDGTAEKAIVIKYPDFGQIGWFLLVVVNVLCESGAQAGRNDCFKQSWTIQIARFPMLFLAVLFLLQRGSEALHESQVLSDLRFEPCNHNTTTHVLLQKFVIALLKFSLFCLRSTF
jgi:hypothetical protein